MKLSRQLESLRKETISLDNLKFKTIEKNSRNITHLAINESEKTTLIYFRGVSKITGDIQWYESKSTYSLIDAQKVFKNGDFSEILSDGITKSNTKNWHKTQSEINSEKETLEKLTKKELIEIIIEQM
tara:strand:+ start:500 stop:883 length:384 start_codon:yes stop_codon:yes gene_type:complete